MRVRRFSPGFQSRSQHAAVPPQAVEPRRQVARRRLLAELDDEAGEVVVLVVVRVVVMGRPGGQILLGAGRKPQEYRRVDRAVAGAQQADLRA